MPLPLAQERVCDTNDAGIRQAEKNVTTYCPKVHVRRSWVVALRLEMRDRLRESGTPKVE